MTDQLDELLSTLEVANKAVERLCASHGRLLAAAKQACEAMDRIVGPYGYTGKCRDDLKAAIAAAEELAL